MPGRFRPDDQPSALRPGGVPPRQHRPFARFRPRGDCRRLPYMRLGQPFAPAADRLPCPPQQQRLQGRVNANQRAAVQSQRPVRPNGFRSYSRPASGSLLLQIVQRSSGSAGEPRQRIRNLRVQLRRQRRHQVEPYPVAGEILHIVSAVIPVADARGPAVGNGVGAAQRQQGPPQPGRVFLRVWPRAHFPHPAQAVQPAAPGNVQQRRFRQVVGGMPYGNGAGSHFTGHPRQEPVAQIPRRLLERTDAAFPLVSRHIHFLNRQSSRLPQPPHKIGIVIRLLPPEIVNQMRRVQREPQPAPGVGQRIQQRTGIRPPRSPYNHRIARPQPGAPRRRHHHGVNPPPDASPDAAGRRRLAPAHRPTPPNTRRGWPASDGQPRYSRPAGARVARCSP